MKNFIFISPNFPDSYWKFCAELKNNGLELPAGILTVEDMVKELKQKLCR